MGFIRTFLTVVFIFFAPSLLFALNGSIRGSVVDGKTGETLPGVTVYLEGTTLGTITDFDGKFNIQVNPGKYDVRVSYISYETVIIKELEVKPGDVVLLNNLHLKEATVDLSEITITAEAIKNTEVAMLMMKQKAVTLMDGISAVNFKKIGDSDAASSLKRVSGISVVGGKYVFVRGLGDRYTKTILNGMDIPGLDPDRNTLQMDIFPTNLIDNIIVHKSFSADLSADFTGGVIDITTKDFPERKTGNISLGLGYNNLMHFNQNYLSYEGGKTDFLGFDDGTRAIPATDNIPFFSDVVADPDGPKGMRFREIMGNFNPLMAAQKENSLMDYSLGFNFGNQLPGSKRTFGYNVSFTYKVNQEFYENAKFGNFGLSSDPSINTLEKREYTVGDYGVKSVLLGGLAGFAMKTQRSKYILNVLHLQNGESRAGLFNYSGSDQGSNFEAMQHNLEYSQRGLTNILLSGNHYTANNKWEIEWKLSPTRSSINDPDIRFTRYETRGESFSIGTEVGFPERIWRELDEINLAGQFNVTRSLQLFDHDAKLRFGSSYTYKDRDYQIRSFALNVRGLALTGNPDELFYPENIWPHNGNLNLGTTYESRFIPNNFNQFSSNNQNIALYISTELQPFEKFKAILGLRAENFEQFYTGQNQTGGNSYDNEKVLGNLDFFPAVNMIYSITSKQNLRISYSQTIARPSFKEMSFAEIFDPISGRVFVGGLFRDADDVAGIEYWNGNLRETKIQNVDLRWELFNGHGQTISMGVFYKTFDHPIEIVQYVSQKGAFQPRNVGDGSVQGMEMELRQSLEFFSDALSKFTLSTNLTFSKSQIELSATEYKSRLEIARNGEKVDKYRVMAGQAPFIVNAGLAYEGGNKGFWKGFEAGIYYNMQGATLEIVGIADRPDVYTMPFNSLNLNANKSFGENKKWQIGLKIENLLGDNKESVFRAFKAQDEFFTYLKQGRTIQFRLGYKLF